jgi:uncharacterized protein (TIGR03067 family)
MRTLSAIALSVIFLFAASARAGTPKDADVKKDVEKFQGKWTVASIEENGKAAPADEVAKFEVTIKGDVFTVKIKDEENKEMTIKVDATKKPAAIDLVPKNAKEPTVLGIYKLDGDTLTICGTDEKKERPAEFATGKGITTIVLKRAK